MELERFDPAPYIDTPEAEGILLSDAFESGDPAYIAHALGIVARARGIAQIARDAGISRPTLYAAISGDGDPKLSTLLALTKALGVKINIQVAA